jgi:transcriptional regulator with XRE-family HTH domain
MGDNAAIFWENVKEAVKAQNTTQEWVAGKAGISFNTFQGWISKGIFPRVNEAVRIAAVLNTSVESLVNNAVRDNAGAVRLIYQSLPVIEEHLKIIKEAVKKLQ